MKSISIVILIFFVSLLLVSCQSETQSGFEDLSVNLSGIEALGIAPKKTNIDVENKQLRKLGSNINTEQYVSEKSLLEFTDSPVESILVGANANGDLVKIEFYNNDNEPVQIEYNLFYFDVYGEFTYLIYFNGVEAYSGLLNPYYNFFNQSNLSSIFSRTIIDELFTSEFGILDIRKIIIHNESGKVFDFTNIVSEITKVDGYQGTHNLSNFISNSTNQFFVTKKMNLATENESNTCTYSTKFNQETLELDIDSQCSSVDFFPILGTFSDLFIYSYTSLNYRYIRGESIALNSDASNDMFDLKTFRISSDHKAIFYQDGTIEVFNEELNLVKTLIVDEENRSIDRKLYVFYQFENLVFIKDLENVDNLLFIYDLETEDIVYGKEDTEKHDTNFSSIVQNDSIVFIFGSNKVISINLENMETFVIFEGKTINAYMSHVNFLKSGYIKVDYIEGISRVFQVIDPSTGNVISTEDSGITKNFWSVKPIN